MLMRRRDRESREMEDDFDREELKDLEDLEGFDDEEIGGDLHLVTNGVMWFTAGLLVGALIGAGTALFSAPDKGRVTRRKIARRIGHLADDAKDQVDDWREDARRVFERRRKEIRRR